MPFTRFKAPERPPIAVSRRTMRRCWWISGNSSGQADRSKAGKQRSGLNLGSKSMTQPLISEEPGYWDWSIFMDGLASLRARLHLEWQIPKDLSTSLPRPAFFSQCYRSSCSRGGKFPHLTGFPAQENLWVTYSSVFLSRSGTNLLSSGCRSLTNPWCSSIQTCWTFQG